MDEVFGVDNFVVTIVIQKKGSQAGDLIQPINDYVLWYAKKKYGAAGALNVRWRPLYEDKVDSSTDDSYDRVELRNGEEKPAREARGLPDARPFVANPLTSKGLRKDQSRSFHYIDREFSPGKGSHWKTTVQHDDGSMSGMARLAAAERLWVGKTQLRFKAYRADFGFKRLTNLWTGLGGTRWPKGPNVRCSDEFADS